MDAGQSYEAREDVEERTDRILDKGNRVLEFGDGWAELPRDAAVKGVGGVADAAIIGGGDEGTVVLVRHAADHLHLGGDDDRGQNPVEDHNRQDDHAGADGAVPEAGALTGQAKLAR